MNVSKAFFVAAGICFILGAFQAGGYQWVPIGLAVLTGGFIASKP
jgi:hypothetical protein